MAEHEKRHHHKKDKCKAEIPCRDREEVINDLLESIALEETSLANIMTAEAKKVCEAVKKFDDEELCLEELIALNDSTEGVLKNIIKKEMLLEFKLEEVNKIHPYEPSHGQS